MSREKRAWTGSHGFSRSGATASLCGGLILPDWSLSATCHNVSARQSPSALGEYLLAPHGVKRSIDCTLARSAAEYRGSPASPLLTWSPVMYRGCGVGQQGDEGRATARGKLQFQQPDWKWKKSQGGKKGNWDKGNLSFSPESFCSCSQYPLQVGMLSPASTSPFVFRVRIVLCSCQLLPLFAVKRSWSAAGDRQERGGTPLTWQSPFSFKVILIFFKQQLLMVWIDSWSLILFPSQW